MERAGASAQGEDKAADAGADADADADSCNAPAVVRFSGRPGLRFRYLKPCPAPNETLPTTLPTAGASSADFASSPASAASPSGGTGAAGEAAGTPPQAAIGACTTPGSVGSFGSPTAASALPSVVSYVSELSIEIDAMRIVWLSQWVNGWFDYLDFAMIAAVSRGDASLLKAKPLAKPLASHSPPQMSHAPNPNPNPMCPNVPHIHQCPIFTSECFLPVFTTRSPGVLSPTGTARCG